MLRYLIIFLTLGFFSSLGISADTNSGQQETTQSKTDTNCNILLQLPNGPLLQQEVEANMLVEDLRSKVANLAGIPFSKCKLVYRGRLLEDGKTIKNYGITRDSLVRVFMPLPGD